jgi:hypothetical protein
MKSIQCATVIAVATLALMAVSLRAHEWREKFYRGMDARRCKRQ